MMTDPRPARVAAAGTCMVCRTDDATGLYTISEPLVSSERSLVCLRCEPIFLGAFESLQAKNRHLILELRAVL